MRGERSQVLASRANMRGAGNMKGTIVLSHGLESGPDATKVSALAKVAEACGWSSVRPDYRDLDATRSLEAIGARTARALVKASPARWCHSSAARSQCIL